MPAKKSEEKEMILPDFLIIPMIVRKAEGLKPSDWLVYSVIYWFTKLKGERCYASNKTIGEVAGIETSTARDSVSRLAKKGFIKVILNARKERVEIIPKVSFKLGGVSSDNDRGVSSDNDRGVVRQRQGVSSDNEQKKNIVRRRTKKKNTAPPNGDASPNSLKTGDKTPRKKRDDGDPMDLKAFVDFCSSSDQRHINIIGAWAKSITPQFTTYGQWRSFLKRNLRAARELVPFTDQQITDAYDKMMTAVTDEKYLTKYTLETLIKFL